MSFRAFQVVEVLDRLARQRGKPKTLKVDNGPEFAGRMLDQWAYLNGVEIDFSRPGKPTDNGHIEAFNGRLRAECLNANWFLSLAYAKDRIEEWRRHLYARGRAERRIHSFLLSRCRCGVSIFRRRSMHRSRRIHLYPVETRAVRTTISFTTLRMLRGVT